MTLPPNSVSIGSMKTRYSAVSTALDATQAITALPMLRWALSRWLAPRLMDTKAQAPSPIITAMASATTVSGNTTVLAALP